MAADLLAYRLFNS